MLLRLQFHIDGYCNLNYTCLLTVMTTPIELNSSFVKEVYDSYQNFHIAVDTNSSKKDMLLLQNDLKKIRREYCQKCECSLIRV